MVSYDSWRGRDLRIVVGITALVFSVASGAGTWNFYDVNYFNLYKEGIA